MNKKPLAVIILAAGKGTRMKSDQPKVMHGLAGLPMINWLLRTVEGVSAQKIMVVCGPDMPDLEAAVSAHKNAEIVIQKERNGTGGAARIAMDALEKSHGGTFDGDILILLGDTPLIKAQTIQHLIDSKAEAGLSVLGMHCNNPTGYGRLITSKDQNLLKIVEEKDATAEEKSIQSVNTGAFCVDGTKLSSWLSQITNNNAQGEFYATDLPEIAASDGAQAKVAMTYDGSEVQGCNSRSDLATLENTLQNRLRKQVMDQGVTMIDPKTVYLSHDTEIASDVLIEPNVFFGPGVSVEQGVHIKAFCHFEGATLGKNITIGPFARLRPGTTLGDEVRIGNFVEVKNSTIGNRSKINHLGYVGDTEMAEDVNFSAGAITVNYDGFQKHKTHIGKDVMVGSNVNLVAPVSIDDGAFLAAGSTITEDVPADALSVERTRAEIRKGWAAQYRKMKARAKSKLKNK